MRKKATTPMVVLLALVGLMTLAPVAQAHNAGHVFLPSGECVDVGSGKEAPLVPESNPNRNDQGQLDLITGPGDQYGARFAAARGNTPILPAECP